jgi:hypothetical protein
MSKVFELDSSAHRSTSLRSVLGPERNKVK